MFYALVFILPLLVSACSTNSPLNQWLWGDGSNIKEKPKKDIYGAIEAYKSVADNIQLGSSKEEVLTVLLPYQERIPEKYVRTSDKYLLEGSRYEVHFIRSARFEDGVNTDDEYTPYVFKNDILIAVGWSYLGGPKTYGKSKSSTGYITFGGRKQQPKMNLHCREALVIGDSAAASAHCN